MQRASTASPRSGSGPAAVDAFADLVDGCYQDPLVTVRPATSPARPSLLVRTVHFDLTTADRRVLLDHRLTPGTVDDGLGRLLHEELFAPGWLRGGDLFERLFTGVVRSVAADATEGWECFYRNTLDRLAVPVHDHALGLLADGSVLQLGCGFGFLALRAARSGRPTTAADGSRGTTRLVAAIAPRLGVPLVTVTADAARHPGPGGQVDTVLAVHLLEHLSPPHGTQVLAEALRLARRRVVVAVPLEAEADEVFGHVRTVTLADLQLWGASTGCRFEVHEHHGGWLVLDRR